MKLRLLFVFILLGMVLYGGYAFYRYRQAQQVSRLIEEARKNLAEGKVREAAVAAQRSHQVAPTNADTSRILAEVSHAIGSREEISWRRSVLELEPGSTANVLELVKAALSFDDLRTAEVALGLSRNANPNDPHYREAAGRVALAQGKRDLAEKHFEASLAVAPQNPALIREVAKLHLSSPEKETQDRALAALEKLTQYPSFQRQAWRLLLGNAMQRRDARRAVELAKALSSDPDAPLEDRLLALGVFHKARRRSEFVQLLTEMQNAVKDDPPKLAALISWMNTHSLAILAAEWMEALAAPGSLRPPVVAARAETYATLGDWPKLLPLVENTDWGTLDFMRRAFLARYLEHEGLNELSRSQWHLALEGAATSPQALIQLMQLARRWDWNDRVDDILWKTAAHPSSASSALRQLFGLYSAQKKTTGLYRVSKKLLEVEPENLAVKNNVAALALLLGVDEQQAHRLAAENYKVDPKNPVLASTYAYSLYKQKRIDEARITMEALPPSELEDPSIAAYYGLVLAAKPETMGKAAQYLKAAAKGNLHPEERVEVDRALQTLESSPEDARSPSAASAKPPVAAE